MTNNDTEFDAWMRKVNAEVDRITGGVGFTSDDFRDWEYRDAFDSEVDPVEAARAALAEDVTGSQFLELAGIDPDELEI
jgi:hypothetical protein